MPNPPDLVAEAKRRLMGTPALTEEQITTWLAQVEECGGQLVLTFDGNCFAEYQRQPATHADS